MEIQGHPTMRLGQAPVNPPPAVRDWRDLFRHNTTYPGFRDQDRPGSPLRGHAETRSSTEKGQFSFCFREIATLNAMLPPVRF